MVDLSDKGFGVKSATENRADTKTGTEIDHETLDRLAFNLVRDQIVLHALNDLNITPNVFLAYVAAHIIEARIKFGESQEMLRRDFEGNLEDLFGARDE